ncbi:MAG: B12-binding domain-containing radical SAM protein [Oscillospiraceae bacterium]|nr:B12-binding domain-containing radical SAM protein [Oscillospiraceae bacterium]
MKILLVCPNGGFYGMYQDWPMGLLAIASYLKQFGHEIRIYDRNVETVSLRRVVREFKPQISGVSVFTTNCVKDGLKVSAALKNMGIPVVWGGYVATIAPELVIAEHAADYVVINEGEVTFHELLQALERGWSLAEINGLAYRDASGQVHRTEPREFANLAKFQPTDWSLIRPQRYLSPFFCCNKLGHLYCSKGCPARCTFCMNESYHKCQYRKRPNEHVVQEIAYLAREHGMDGVRFADELFGANKAELYDLCDRIRALNLKVFSWGCQTRLGHFNREDLQHMHNAGCRWIFFGVESGCPDMQKRINKRIDLTKVVEQFEMCKEIGISVFCNFIIGFPDETKEQIKKSVQLAQRLESSWCSFVIFFPSCDSALERELIQRGQLQPLQSLRQLSSKRMVYQGVSNNYSQVPTRDLLVVQSHFMWKSFFAKGDSAGMSRYSIATKSIKTMLRMMFSKGLLSLFGQVFTAARTFFGFAWYRFAYPKIRREYGLR